MEFKITKREVLASITIFAVLFLIGLLISSKISESKMDKDEVYNKALKVTSADIFSYGMRTDVGNAFVYGDLSAVDPVTYPEIGGQYMYAEKITERYTRHTRQVAHTRKVGKTTSTYYTTEVYWTWDEIDRDKVQCKKLLFCGSTFDSSLIPIPDDHYIKTVDRDINLRDCFYGTDTKFTGTIFTNLKNNTIAKDTVFYKDKNIDQTIDDLESGGGVIIFWVLWIIFIGLCIFGFYYLDNNWLEDENG